MVLKLRGVSREDLLGVPAVMLGFYPEDSCAVLALREHTVELCARVNVDWYMTAFADTAARIVEAAQRVGASRFVVIGYGSRQCASASVAEMIDVLGPGAVWGAFVVEGSRFWEFGSDTAESFSFLSSVLAAEATYAGLQVHSTREEAVAAVKQRAPAVAQEVAHARQNIALMTREMRLTVLQRLAESASPLTPTQALTLALLLLDEDCLAALVVRLNTASAEAMSDALAAARAVTPEDAEERVLAVLALASWLAGRAAAHTSCAEQLTRLHPTHPVAMLALRIHRAGIPPRCWDWDGSS